MISAPWQHYTFASRHFLPGFPEMALNVSQCFSMLLSDCDLWMWSEYWFVPRHFANSNWDPIECGTNPHHKLRIGTISHPASLLTTFSVPDPALWLSGLGLSPEN